DQRELLAQRIGDAMIEVLNIRITDSLREKLTLIYGGSMNGSLSKFPEQTYSIGTSLPCGPENVPKVIAAMQAEIEKMKTSGPDPEDLQKVKRNWLESHRKSLREN